MRLFRIVCAGFVMLCSSALLFAQTPAKRPLGQTPDKPAFEVASIKPSAPLPTLMAQIKSEAIRPGMTVNGSGGSICDGYA
jgi:hypothetical protein